MNTGDIGYSPTAVGDQVRTAQMEQAGPAAATARLMTDIITTEDLQGAVESLDVIIAGMRTAGAVGIDITVEKLALTTSQDPCEVEAGSAGSRRMLGVRVGTVRAFQAA